MTKQNQSGPKGGAAHRRSAGLKPIGLNVTDEEHQLIRVAAAIKDVSMAEFSRLATVEAAKKISGK